MTTGTPIEGAVEIALTADGSDQSAIINAAMRDSTATVFILPPGQYWIGDNIYVPAGKKLIGAGQDETVLNLLPGFAMDDNRLIVLGNGSGLSNLTLDLQKVHHGMGTAQRICGVVGEGTDFLVESVTVKNATGYAFWANGQQLAELPLASGTFRDCIAENSNVLFETTSADGVLFENCVGRDGDNDIALESAFHPIANSSNITFLNCSYSGDSTAVSVVAVGVAQRNIVFENCDFTTTGAALGTFIGGTGGNQVFIRNSIFRSDLNNAVNLQDSELSITNSTIESGRVAISVTGGTVSAVDSNAISAAEAGYGGAAFAIYTAGGTVAWDGGFLSASGGAGSATARGNVTVTPRTAHAIGERPATDEATPLLLAVAANDRGADGLATAVARVDGQAIAEGGSVTLASGATVTLTGGGLAWHPGTAFAHLAGAASGAVNFSAFESFGYTLTGGGHATVIISVAGLRSAGDRLEGNGADNVIAGGDTADSFHVGQGGADRLSGLGGDDLFHFGSAFRAGDEVDGGEGDDAIILEGDYSGEKALLLADVRLTGIERILLLAGGAYEIAAGDAAVAAGRRLTVDASALAAGESLRFDGSGEFDGAFTLLGGAGDDLLIGGALGDVMKGGAGNDRYRIDHPDDLVVEEADGGIDRIETPHSFSLAGTNVEILILTGEAAVDGTGSDGADALIGNGAANRLDGGAGADGMNGGDGDDVYFVDDPGDRVIEASAAGGRDTVYSSVSFSLAYQHIERLFLAGAAAIDATGNSLANTLVGNAAANLLDGKGGVDVMNGGAGDDTYVVDQSGDTVIEETGGGIDTVRSSATFALSRAYEIENLTLTGFAAVSAYGNDLANVLTGNDNNNVLNGSAGADRMTGKGGTDTYFVDDEGDLVFEEAGGGVDTVHAAVSYTLPACVENGGMLGDAALDLTGNDLANRLFGNAGDNMLDGGAGADYMTGRGGNDTYIVDDAGDRVLENNPDGGTADRILASVSNGLGGIYIETLELTGGADIDATGNSLANTLLGNSGANILSGKGGNDMLTGGGGADIFWFDTALSESANVDAILDFAPGEDRIRLKRSIFAGIAGDGALDEAAFHLGTAAADAAHRILYDPESGSLRYDPDGDGARTAVLFATVTPGTALTHLDFEAFSFG